MREYIRATKHLLVNKRLKNIINVVTVVVSVIKLIAGVVIIIFPFGGGWY